MLQNPLRQQLGLTGVTVGPFGNVAQQGQPVLSIDRISLAVTFKQTASGMTGTCSYKAGLLEPNAAQPWVPAYKAILAKAAANPEIQMGRLTLL